MKVNENISKFVGSQLDKQMTKARLREAKPKMDSNTFRNRVLSTLEELHGQGYTNANDDALLDIPLVEAPIPKHKTLTDDFKTLEDRANKCGDKIDEFSEVIKLQDKIKTTAGALNKVCKASGARLAIVKNNRVYPVE